MFTTWSVTSLNTAQTGPGQHFDAVSYNYSVVCGCNNSAEERSDGWRRSQQGKHYPCSTWAWAVWQFILEAGQLQPQSETGKMLSWTVWETTPPHHYHSLSIPVPFSSNLVCKIKYMLRHSKKLKMFLNRMTNETIIHKPFYGIIIITQSC